MSTTSVNAGITAGPRDSDNLFYKVFSGETLTTFNANTVLKDRIRTRSISSGKSAGFNAIGKVTAGYHQPGNVILGQKVNNGEIVITIDDMLTPIPSSAITKRPSCTTKCARSTPSRWVRPSLRRMTVSCSLWP